MRLAFICSGLEPGRDGVGDYTRLLAAECVRQGHEVLLIALNDKAAAVEGGLGAQECEGIALPCVRYAVSRPWSERFELARAELAAFAPDWVSLQFVPYGFQPKGLPWFLARGLEKVIAKRPLQIMFHELWIGFGVRAPWKERLVGMLQRRCIFGLIRRLRPRVVQTSNATYAGLLGRGGVKARELPLFGNIPIAPEGVALPSALAEAGVPCDPGRRGGWLVGLFFGTIHPEWEPEPLLGRLLNAARSSGKQLCLVSAGRMGETGVAIWERLRAVYGGQLTCVRCGELPVGEISALMRAADFGVSVSPWNLMGKSGSAAAMLDHGLPVIFTREDGLVCACEAEALAPFFYRCDEMLQARVATGLPKREPRRRLGEICARFLASLPVASPPEPLSHD